MIELSIFEVLMSDDRIERLKALGASTIYEAAGQRGYIDRAIAPLDPATRVAGRAYTVDGRPGDNLMIHYAISRAEPGDIVVVDYKGFMRAAATGDLMALSAKARGIGGLVVDGAARDATAIVEMGFPVFCRGLCIVGPTKTQAGRVQVPVVVGGCLIHPGDFVIGDRDGLVVVPAAELDSVLTSASEREAREAGIRAQLAEGATTVVVMGMTETLKTLGFA